MVANLFVISFLLLLAAAIVIPQVQYYRNKQNEE